MIVFITGATGFIGGSLADRLLSKGHAVHGLVRSPEKAALLTSLGIEPVLGSLDDFDILRASAAAADAVINAANSDHEGAVEALLTGLAGTGKPFLQTSGSSVVADNACGEFQSDLVFEDDTPFDPRPERAGRAALDRRVREAASSGIRSAVLCNSLIYGTGLGLAKDSVQVPPLVAQGCASGTVRTVGPGKNVWSNVHLNDVLDLYELALEKAPPGAFYFVENGEASFQEIGQAIARRFHLRGPEPWSVDEAAAAWGGMKAAYSLGSNSRVRGIRAREELRWAPKHRSVTNWIEREMEVTLP